MMTSNKKYIILFATILIIAFSVVSLLLVNTCNSRAQTNHPVWLKKGESLKAAIKRAKTIPPDEQHSDAKWTLIRLDARLLELAKACIRHGRLDDALLVMKEITHDVPKSDILLAIAFRQYDLADDKEKIAKEEEFFKPFEEYQTQYGNSEDEEKRRDIYFRDERYCGYIIRLAQRGLMDRAGTTLKKITLQFQKTEAMYTIAMKYALNGEFEKALRLAQTMENAGTGSFDTWEGMHADGIGPSYSKLQTMTMILNMATSGNYGDWGIQPLQFVDELETNDAKVHLLLAVISTECTTNRIRDRRFFEMLFSQHYDVPIVDDKPLLQDSENAKNLLRRALTLTRTIDDRTLRETVLLELLPFLVEAKMADESYQGAGLIDTSGDYVTEQKILGSDSYYSTVIPSHITSVISLLIAEQHHAEALVLCQKVIDWIKPLRSSANSGIVPDNIRNEIICRYAEFQAEAGSIEKARRTLAEERALIDSLSHKAPYLRRVAETLAKIGDRDTAEQTYIDAISNTLDKSVRWPTYRDQLKHFDSIIEGYCDFTAAKGHDE